MPDYSWPPKAKRRLFGKRWDRIDGVSKSSGKTRFGSDQNPQGLLQSVILTCPHAHARIISIDTSEAERMTGVAAVKVISKPGTEVQWAGTEVVGIAATTIDIARDAMRKVKVEYEVLPHMVRDEDLSKAGNRVKPGGEQITGDPDKGFQDSEVTSEGTYGIPVITHACMETHGQTMIWGPSELAYWSSTQNVSGIGGDVAKTLGIPTTFVHVMQEQMGGGFGSKFSSDRWGAECALLSKMSGGKPVKLFLERSTDQMIAGNRPSAFAKIKLGAKKDGTILAWQSESWGTGGFTGGFSPTVLPYVFTTIPNQRKVHSNISVNAGGNRAWRAPNHPQASYLTCCALDDLAAALKMDPMDLFAKNADYTARAEVYRSQLKKAAELIDWKKKWHQRGDSGTGYKKRGMGIGVGTWGGAGHASQCRCNIHPDGAVEIELGSQDNGTGTRTVIVLTAAETLGLPIQAIKLKIGDSKYPPSGASGGSTTVGGVSSSTRKATVDALEKLFAAVAPALGVPPDQLEAVDSKIQVKGNPAKALTWKAACQKLGVSGITTMGENNPKSPGGLNTGGVGGAQAVEAEVDTETGLIRLIKFVAVQDCGLIISLKTAESQVYGSMIMSVCAALFEERIMDQATGRMVNADMEFYKLAGIGDMPEMVVHMNMEDEHDKRGVIGLGEPPVIPGIAAIANAVANAIGVRVPMVPMTPKRVLAALERRNA